MNSAVKFPWPAARAWRFSFAAAPLCGWSPRLAIRIFVNMVFLANWVCCGRHCERSDAIHDFRLHGLPRFARNDEVSVHGPCAVSGRIRTARKDDTGSWPWLLKQPVGLALLQEGLHALFALGAGANAGITSSLQALRTSGRFRVTRATAPGSIVSVAMFSNLATFSSHQNQHRGAAGHDHG